MSTPGWLIVALTAASVGPLSYTYGQRAGHDDGVRLSDFVASDMSAGCSKELASLWQDYVEGEAARGEALDALRKYDP